MTTHSLEHRRSSVGRGYAQAVDHAAAHLGIILLRWANHRMRRRALTHETQSRLRQIESGRAARELDAQRLHRVRGC